MKIFLHVGFHKTGTTSFQRLLATNRDRFAPGFNAYANLIGNGHTAETGFPRFHKTTNLYGPAALRADLSAFRDRILADGCTTALVSMENAIGRIPRRNIDGSFYRRGRLAIDILDEVFQDHAPEYIFSTRRAESWARSLHGHLVLHRGLNTPEDRFLRRQHLETFDWDNQIAMIMARSTSPRHRFDLEDDVTRPLGPGAGILNLIGPNRTGADSFRLPEQAENIGLGAAEKARLFAPHLRILPPALRRVVALRLARTSTRSPLPHQDSPSNGELQS